jgi:hypothetical protein
MNVAMASGVEVDTPLLTQLEQYAIPVNGKSLDV